MEQNNKIHMVIEMDLEPESLLKNDLTLAKSLNWFRLRDDAVVDQFTVRLTAPTECSGGNNVFLPHCYFALKRYLPDEFADTGLLSETFEVSTPGNPLSFIQDGDDASRFAESVIARTSALESEENSDDYWGVMVRKCEAHLLSACCLYLITTCGQEDHNLPNVIRMLRCGFSCGLVALGDSALDILFCDLENADAGNSAVAAFRSFKNDAGLKAAQQALRSCVYRLENMTLAQLMDVMTDMHAA